MHINTDIRSTQKTEWIRPEKKLPTAYIDKILNSENKERGLKNTGEKNSSYT